MKKSVFALVWMLASLIPGRIYSGENMVSKDYFEFGNNPIIITRKGWYLDSKVNIWQEKPGKEQVLIYKVGEGKYLQIPIALIDDSQYSSEPYEELGDYYHEYNFEGAEMEELHVGGDTTYIGYCKFPIKIGSKWENNKNFNPGNSEREGTCTYEITSSNITLKMNFGTLKNIFTLKVLSKEHKNIELRYIAPKLGAIRSEGYSSTGKLLWRNEVMAVRWIKKRAPKNPKKMRAFVKEIQNEELIRFRRAKKAQEIRRQNDAANPSAASDGSDQTPSANR